MLDCRAVHRLKQQRDRNRAYRDRRRRGQLCVTVTIDGEVLNFLERSRWLSERDAHDPQKVGEAIAGLLELSAKI
jgi:O-methyltransferase involved in polyketide biosynthesis